MPEAPHASTLEAPSFDEPGQRDPAAVLQNAAICSRMSRKVLTVDRLLHFGRRMWLAQMMAAVY